MCNFQPFCTILVAVPTISATGSSILPSETTFSQVFKNLNFLPTGGRFKNGFLEIFSKLEKYIHKLFFPAGHPLNASPERVLQPWRQNYVKMRKVQKTYFWGHF